MKRHDTVRNSTWWSGAPLSIIAGVSLLAACTVNVEMPAVPETHPANPEAAVAPLPEPSPLLDSYRPVESPPDVETMDHEGHDSSHRMSGDEDEGMTHGTSEGEHGKTTQEEHRKHRREPDHDSHHFHETEDNEEPER